MALTALAGPVSNIIMAFIFMFIGLLIQVKLGISEGSFTYYITVFMITAAQINISLAVFNLLPIPPLDGSRIFSLIIPDKYYYAIMQYERYIVYGVLALVFFGVLDGPINFLSDLLFDMIFGIAALPLGI